MDGALGTLVEGTMSATSDTRLTALEDRLGHTFQDRALLDRALTHASAAGTAADSYQRLEFLGDRVLGLIIADALLKAFPHADEGELARRFNQLVRRETCAEVARELDFGAEIRLAEAEAQAGGRSKTTLLGDVCEAVIAALYLDGGEAAARAFIEASWMPRMHNWTGPLRDPKTSVQEWAQARDLVPPTYQISTRSGPDHDPQFKISMTVGDLAESSGQGKSKRAAEQEAARNFLLREGIWEAG
jgi:ribonuclease-3